MELSRTLYVFHYHLLAGGVSTVIRDGLHALILHSKLLRNIDRIVVVTAGKEHDQLPVADDKNCPTIIHDRLDLVGYDDGTSSAAEQYRLSDFLLQRYDAGIWWVHNYHLAKNSCFTGAILIAAAAGQRLILQVHDFPENARLSNLRKLLQEVPFPLYPTGSNVHYIVINNRDRKALVAAGLPAASVTLVANPIRPTVGDRASQRTTAQQAKSFLTKATVAMPSFGTGTFDDRKPVWLYPVRTRRRKNILEAGLLARLSQANLLVTLRASSIYEKPYSQSVEELFENGVIPGLFGIGEGLKGGEHSLCLLIAAASRIVSSSVEEGFGFQFINALQWQRPLLARRLPVLDDISNLLKDYPAIIYDAVLCPVSVNARTMLLSAYHQKIARLSIFLPREFRDSLHAELETTLSEEMVDFSFLSVEQQVDLLRRMTDKGLTYEIESSNKMLLTDIRRSTSMPPDLNPQIDELFGEHRYAMSLSKILHSLSCQPKKDSLKVTVQPEVVREYYANPALIRLLMDS